MNFVSRFVVGSVRAACRTILSPGTIALALAASAAAPTFAADREKDSLTPQKIQQSIEKARDWLLRQQRANGSWECSIRTEDTRVGATALVMLALANAGVDRTDVALQRGLDWLRREQPNDTYSVSLQTLVMAMLSPGVDRVIIERNAAWLEKAQVTKEPAKGSWSYGQSKGTGDNSNAQFALLALHEADRVGVSVKRDVWRHAYAYWAGSINADGSWGYTVGNSGGSGSMTCAGIASMWITAEHTGTPDADVKVDSILCCAGGKSPAPLERGLQWLGKNFSVAENPRSGQTWLHYYLYGLERVGRFTARRFMGPHDWYLEGSKALVASQDVLNGSFRGGRIEDPIVATSFALLFLAKGRRPVLIGKSRHLPEDDWNRHGHDIAHLVEYVESRWRDDHPAGLSWHIVDTRAAALEDLLQAPILWLSGKDAFELGPDAGERLRRYIDEGGFIFAEASCAEGKAFDARMRQLVGQIFPEPEYQLHLLPPEHPAWHAEKIVPPEDHRPLLGVDYGCRTCLIYSPPAAGDEQRPPPSLSCLWELGGASSRGLDAGVRRHVDAALAIGANVIAYATNRELKRKDELFTIATTAAAPSEDDYARGQISLAKLRHTGMCDAAPAALANILRAAARELGVRVDDTPNQIDPADPRLFTHHLVFMHGRQGFSYDAPRRENLRQFLERGGTLLADSICASAAFTASFRAEIAAILPAHTLEEIPAADPLFTAAAYGGYDIREVSLREPTGGDGPMNVRKRKVAPKLEGVKLGDRWAVIFSPYDLSCALEKQNSLECTGYSRDDAEKIALNVLLYSLHH